MKPLALMAYIVVFLLSGTSFGAEFEIWEFDPSSTAKYQVTGVSIKGKIERGDYRRFQELVHQGENIWELDTVYLDSPGGDVVEQGRSMKIR